MRIIGIIFLAAMTISCASSLPPAEPSNDMMDKADRVILTIDEDPEVAYHNIVQHLIDRGYTIKKSNINTLALQTGYREYGATVFGILGGYSMKIFASVEDSTISFSGELSTGTEIENTGGKTSPVKSGWDEIVKIAKDYPHKKVYYSRNR